MNTVAVRTVTKIEANPLLVRANDEFRRKNVAGYCRVSTDAEDQINSYQAQIAYYTETIAKNPNWTFVGIYADEGITGTSTNKRKDFMRLMRDCEKGKVDYILTKSISRFARNTVDSLMWTRKLRAMGIGVYFEEQALDSLKAENEMLIGMFSVIAQSESENISANVKWGVRQSMKSGTYMTNFTCFGYRRGKEGVPDIVEEEAEVVRTLFNRYLDGDSVDQLKEYLEGNHILTHTGKAEWNRQTIRDILTNEKYVGDLLLQKSYITDCITKKSKRNRGELPKDLVSNNHEPIIDRDTYNLVQVEMARRGNKRKKSDLSITEKGKYSGKYALSDVLICGCCGSYYKRIGKIKNGKKQYVWRCLNRRENGTQYCSDSVGAEETKLHAAICRCMTRMFSERDEVIGVIQSNLQYALSGDTNALSAVALETQIKEHQEQCDKLMALAETTTGDPDRYEAELMKTYGKINELRKQLDLAKAQVETNESLNAEVKRVMQLISDTDVSEFVEYNDVFVRRLVDSIRVMPDRKIIVTLKGGKQDEESF